MIGFNPLSELEKKIEKSFIDFNKFMVLLFVYLKFVFGFIMLFIGILILLRFRGIYKIHRAYSYYEKKSMVTPRIIVGVIYIVFALGIFFNFMIYFLIFILDPLPDQLIFSFITIPSMSKIYEKSVNYIIGLISFLALLTIFLSVFIIVNKEKGERIDLVIKKMISAIIVNILVGFTNGLVLFL